MPRYVAFLRAINVGGHIVKMERLRALFEGAGLANVSTFIASGNVLFESRKAPTQLEAQIEKTLQAALGYEVATMVRSSAELAAIVEQVTSRGLAAEPGVTLYVGLLKEAPAAGAAGKVRAMSNDVDTLEIQGRELYWRCRKSMSESTVVGSALGKALGVPMTTRNINTMQKLDARLTPR